MRHAQLVIGPAGSGKSTYCDNLRLHCENVKRKVHIVNLDPAADRFNYPVSSDIRDLVTLEDVMSELGYGPNGGLVYCMEYLIQNLDWLKDELDDFADDEYLVFDCPGQVELYWHIPVMGALVEALQKWGFNVCAVCLIDSHFVHDAANFMSATLLCLSAMISLQVPHVNVLTKMDLINRRKDLDQFLDVDVVALAADLNAQLPKQFRALNRAMASLIEDYNMVQFIPLDVSDEESMGDLLMHIDNAIQYGEDLEPREVRTPPDQDEPADADDTDLPL